MHSWLLLAPMVLGCATASPALDAAPRSDAATSPAAEPQYLSFQVFTYAPAPPGAGARYDGANVRAIIRDLIDEVGRGDGAGHRLAFAVGPLTLDQTDDELREAIRDAFLAAEENDVALVVHLDDSMFWGSRSELWLDPANVEWTDWAGTVHPHRYVGWMGPTTLPPQMCYESASLRAAVGAVARDVIGAEIAAGLSRLEERGRGALFAGVIAGWETHLPDYRYVDPNSATGRQMTADGSPRVPIGYCSLVARGFSTAAPPADFDEELALVVERWVEAWAGWLGDAGIPRDRIYTHVAAMPPSQITDDVLAAVAAQYGLTEATYLGMTGHSRFRNAFNSRSRPGFSIYGAAADDELLAAIVEHGVDGWALSEGTNGSGMPEHPSPDGWERYLARVFNHGGRVANVFGWAEAAYGDPFGQATRSAEAVQAYRKFLAGEALLE